MKYQNWPFAPRLGFVVSKERTSKKISQKSTSSEIVN